MRRRNNIIRSTVKTALIAKAAGHIGRRVVKDHEHSTHRGVRHAVRHAAQHAMKDAVQHAVKDAAQRVVKDAVQHHHSGQ